MKSVCLLLLLLACVKIESISPELYTTLIPRLDRRVDQDLNTDNDLPVETARGISCQQHCKNKGSETAVIALGCYPKKHYCFCYS